MSPERILIGKIAGGGIEKGLKAEIEIRAKVATGDYLTIIDQKTSTLYLGIVSNLEHPSVSAGYHSSPLRHLLTASSQNILDRRFQRSIAQIEIKTVIQNGVPTSRRTLPGMDALVYLPASEDIQNMLSTPNTSSIEIGCLLSGGYPVSLSPSWMQRSTMIAGATGTGKSMLCRHLISKIIENHSASTLLLDMHDEYAYNDSSRESGHKIEGLRSKYPNDVIVYGLGRNPRVRGVTPDRSLEIGYADIMPADILLLSEELDLNDTTATVIDAAKHFFGYREWFQQFTALAGNFEGDSSAATSAMQVHAWA
jgi:DNA helicase HerA-like ATPase